MNLVLDAIANLHESISTVFDCRGDEPCEMVGSLGETWDQTGWSLEITAVYQNKLQEQQRSCEADKVIVVSEVMADVLCERCGVDRAKITVQPCLVDLSVFPAPDKTTARGLLGIDDRFVVCYLGSLAWYQLPDQGIRLFKLLKKHLPLALFLGITTDPDRLNGMLRESGIEATDFKVISVPSQDVAKYLPAANLGLLLRENNPVNAVASPVKFAEYLACGLPVLITPGVGDYAEVVERKRIGGVVDIVADDDVLFTVLGQILQQITTDSETSDRARRYLVENLSFAPILG